jgi:hypothetical protein
MVHASLGRLWPLRPSSWRRLLWEPLRNTLVIDVSCEAVERVLDTRKIKLELVVVWAWTEVEKGKRDERWGRPEMGYHLSRSQVSFRPESITAGRFSMPSWKGLAQNVNSTSKLLGLLIGPNFRRGVAASDRASSQGRAQTVFDPSRSPLFAATLWPRFPLAVNSMRIRQN